MVSSRPPWGVPVPNNRGAGDGASHPGPHVLTGTHARARGTPTRGPHDPRRPHTCRHVAVMRPPTREIRSCPTKGDRRVSASSAGPTHGQVGREVPLSSRGQWAGVRGRKGRGRGGGTAWRGAPAPTRPRAGDFLGVLPVSGKCIYFFFLLMDVFLSSAPGLPGRSWGGVSAGARKATLVLRSPSEAAARGGAASLPAGLLRTAGEATRA